jgi:hypothetical protein
MADLSERSTITVLARAAPNPAIYNALNDADNQNYLSECNIHSLENLLTPEGERALYGLRGMGKQSMIVLHSFLYEKGFAPHWPHTEAIQVGRASGLSPTLDLTRAVEAADQQYAIKTGNPVGVFSQKIQENTKAQQDGARLQGRRTL